jgi:hypothetical protein
VEILGNLVADQNLHVNSERGYEDVDWIHLLADKNQRRVLMNTAMKFLVGENIENQASCS